MKSQVKDPSSLQNDLMNTSSKKTGIPDSDTKINKVSMESSMANEELKVQLFKTPEQPKRVSNDSDFDPEDKESLEAEIFERIAELYDKVCLKHQNEFEDYKKQIAKQSKKHVKDFTDDDIEEMKSDFAEPYIKENDDWNQQFIYFMNLLKGLSQTDSENAYYFSDSNASENSHDQNSEPNTIELHNEKISPDEKNTEEKFKRYFSFDTKSNSNQENQIQNEANLSKKPEYNPSIIGSTNYKAPVEMKDHNQKVYSNQSNFFSNNAKPQSNVPYIPIQVNNIQKVNQNLNQNLNQNVNQNMIEDRPKYNSMHSNISQVSDPNQKNMFLPTKINQEMIQNQVPQTITANLINKNPLNFDNTQRFQNSMNPNFPQNQMQTNTFNTSLKTQPITDS